ncbi:MAG: hypothetical protein RLZ71_223 [Actinomycetota bacterium]|jgi:formamidopyrimidine-DNA glycosylase
MPELPEVETVRAGLAASITGAKVREVFVHDVRSLKRHPGSPEDFIATLTGATIASVVRRGKFLWLPLNVDDLALVGHLGMSGQMLIRTPGFEADKLNRVTIKLDAAEGPLEFRFVDQRIFGSLALDRLVATDDGGTGGFGSEIALIPTQAAHIARDPLDPQFDEPRVLASFKKKNVGIKRVLLDQQVLSGIGNIYADEALWRAKLHYDTAASSISTAKAKELLQHVREILAKAVEAGGTSFDEQYKNVNGESGYFEVSLNAYGMTGRPCARCGTPIKREAWMNRGSHFCPKCQKRR